MKKQTDASTRGALGGKANTQKQNEARRKNGLKGGRPVATHKNELDILPYLEPSERRHVSKIRAILESMSENRGAVVLDEQLFSLKPYLEKANMTVALVPYGMKDDDIKTEIIKGRIFITNNHKDFVIRGAEYDLRIIATEAVSKDPVKLSETISVALSKYSLWSNRGNWILFLKPNGRHDLKTLPK